MNGRRALALIAAAAVPLVLVAAPAHAAPPAGKGKQVVSEDVSGTLASIKTKARKLVLVGGTMVRWDDNDMVLAQHIYDFAVDWDEDGVQDGVECDLRDSGSAETIARFAQRGIPAEVSGTVYSARTEMSVVWVVANTCDGVIDAADAR